MRNRAVTSEIDPDRTPSIHPTEGYLKGSPPTVPSQDIEEVVGLLSKARRPVIIAGNGALLSKSSPELEQLAQHIGAPVATSYKGKSAFPEVHPLSLGTMGTFGQKVANEVVSQADLILVAGSSLQVTPAADIPPLATECGAKAIIVNLQPTHFDSSADVVIHGDVTKVLPRIVEALERSRED